MKSIEKVEQLRGIIYEQLFNLIDRDYYVLECPYYSNIGDVLIWQGELDFLKRVPYKCKGMYSLETFPIKKIIDDQSLILFQGGGNFGDLWSIHQNFRMDIIKRFSKCKVIIFPQTVWFEKQQNMLDCANFLSRFSDITICARDASSYQILKANFKNNILLVPDMAFCLDLTHWNLRSKLHSNKALFFKKNR